MSDEEGIREDHMWAAKRGSSYPVWVQSIMPSMYNSQGHLYPPYAGAGDLRLLRLRLEAWPRQDLAAQW